MKKFIRTKSSILLIVFCCYLVLSCAPEKDERTQAIENTINKIRERLETKDYNASKHFVNSRQDLQNEVKRSVRYMKKEFETKFRAWPKSKRVKNCNNNLGIFRLTSNFVPVRIDESLTFGFDDPSNFELVVSTATSCYQGNYTSQQLRSEFTEMNNILLNYPLTYSGADQLLSHAVANGSITPT